MIEDSLQRSLNGLVERDKAFEEYINASEGYGLAFARECWNRAWAVASIGIKTGIKQVLTIPIEPSEICDDNYMTVVFDRSVVNFDKNPMHIKSEFGNVVAISHGDALAKLDATTEPVSGALERGAAAVKQLFDLASMPPDSGFTPEDVAQAVIDAVGVTYVD